MDHRLICGLIVALAAVAAGCGTTEHSGARPDRSGAQYGNSFDSLRNGCGGGWVVFEIPASGKAERVTFGFEDTGSTSQPQTQVSARFSWALAG